MTLDLVLVDWKYGKTNIFAAPRNSPDGDLILPEEEVAFQRFDEANQNTFV